MIKVGTIYDKSYFDVWKVDEKVYRRCINCDAFVLMRDKGKLTGGRHNCTDTNNWINFTHLQEDGFVFIPEKE